MSKNIVKQNYKINKEDRNQKNGHQSFLVFFTGLSGSGKSTLANELEILLHSENVNTYVIDGDNLRKGLNSDLNFSAEDRKENIRRIAEVSNLFVESGTVTIAAFISPYTKDRENIKQTVGEKNYVEIFVDTPIETCEKRDVKGLYAKARNGEIPSFTGISAPYERPTSPDLVINTDNLSIEEATKEIFEYIKPKLK